MNRPIEEAWLDFSRKCLPVTAGPVQRQEMRRAFYAGAMGLYSHLMTDLDPGVDPTDADLARMAAIDADLARFGAEVQTGRG